MGVDVKAWMGLILVRADNQPHCFGKLKALPVLINLFSGEYSHPSRICYVLQELQSNGSSLAL